MTNDSIFNKEDYNEFFKLIEKSSSSYINQETIVDVAMLLAIDYKTRLYRKHDLSIYAKDCANKLALYFEKNTQQIHNEINSITLFAIAISRELDSKNDSSKNQEQTQEAILNAVITQHFGFLSKEEKENLRPIIKTILEHKNGSNLVNVVISDPKLFYSNAVNKYRKKLHEQETIKLLIKQLEKIASQQKYINKKIGKTKAIAGKISLATGVIVGAAIATFTGGIAAPLIIAPFAYISIKKHPAIGNSIGTILSKNSHEIKNDKNTLKNLRNKVFLPSKGLSKNKTLSLKKGLEKTTNITPAQKKTKSKQRNR